MEETITQEDNYGVMALSAITGGLLAGLIGGCCCCMPFFFGMISCLIYRKIEHRPVSTMGALVIAGLSGLVGAFPVWAINTISQMYLLKNINSLPPEIATMVREMKLEEADVITHVFSLMQTMIISALLSFAGVAVYLVFRKKD